LRQSDEELLGIFERHFGLAGYGSGHGDAPHVREHRLLGHRHGIRHDLDQTLCQSLEKAAR